MEMVATGSTPLPGGSPLLGHRRRSSSVSEGTLSLATRLIKHVSAYRIQLVVLIGLLAAAYNLPPAPVDVDAPAVNYWSWSYLNRQEAPVSAWLVDNRGVGEGTVANGGWNRDKNGLLVVPKEVTSLRRHPIEVLIKEAQFKAKRIRTTRPRTLKQATRRYWKMFHMDPPKGFDKWFAAFGFPPSILPPAHESFVPFLSVPGQVLRERIHNLDDKEQTFAVEFKDGKIHDVRGQQKDNVRARDLLLLLAPIAHHIPEPLTIYFNTDDVPRFIASYQVLNASTTYGAQASLWPQEDRETLEAAQKGTWGWYWACGRETPVGRRFRDAILEEEHIGEVQEKTFVWDHKKTMDYCETKELFDQHGLFLYGAPQPGELTPLFSTCRSRWSMDIPATPLEAINQTVDAIPWRKKDIPKLYWRGKMTGLFANKEIDWRNSQRLRLHGLGHPKHPEEKISVLQKSRRVGGGWERVERTLGSAAEEWLDVGLVDGPVQCEKLDGTCDEIAREIEFSERVEWQDANPSRHQFVVDVDGNGWSSRMRRVLLRGSVVLKATVFPEWYSDIFIPYYHYVPLQNNYSDLWDILAFFTARPDAAKLIGQQGRDFVLENWRWEDMQAYMLLSLLEYARVMSDDREAMTYRAHREGVQQQ